MDMRSPQFAHQIQALIRSSMLDLYTCIPGIVKAFDSTTQECTVQPAIRSKQVEIDGRIRFIDPPSLYHVPLVFPYATTAGFALTLPVSAGDACLLIFSQRCIDNWHEHGGLQNPEDGESVPGGRHHHIADAFAILCAPPLPNALSNWNSTGIELRDKTGTVKLSVSPAGVEASSMKVATGATGVFPTVTGGSVIVQNGIVVSIT